MRNPEPLAEFGRKVLSASTSQGYPGIVSGGLVNICLSLGTRSGRKKFE